MQVERPQFSMEKLLVWRMLRFVSWVIGIAHGWRSIIQVELLGVPHVNLQDFQQIEGNII